MDTHLIVHAKRITPRRGAFLLAPERQDLPMTRLTVTRTLGVLMSLALTAVSTTPARAHDEDLVRVSVVAEHPGITPGGTVWVGVRMDMEEGWYTYWPGKNDTGMGSSVTADGPDGVTFGDVRWPTPERQMLPGDILDHVYRKSITALIPVTVPPDAEVGTDLQLSFDVSWLVCKSVCIPGDQTVTLKLPVVPELPPADPNAAKLIADTRARVPKPLPTGERIATVQWNGSDATVRVRGAYKLAFYPDTESSIVANIHREGVAQTDYLTLKTVGEPTVLSGILEIFSADGHSRVFQLRSSPASPNG
jgi:DsbC/DsbD-like thiol-disulfide interchange protein